MSIGKILKKIRKEKGMTQVEFAKYLDMSRSFIGDIENDRYVPNPNTIKKLADKLNISTYYLTTGEKLLRDLLQEDMDTISDEEFSEIANRGQEFILKEREEKLRNDLIELSNSKLSASEHGLLRLTITFMQESSASEIDEFVDIIRALSTNRYAHQRDSSSYSNEDRLEKGNGVIEQFRKFVYSYYKITEDSD